MKTYSIYEQNGWKALKQSFSFPIEAIAACKRLAGENAQPCLDMNVHLEKELNPCRFKGKNGEFFIRGR